MAGEIEFKAGDTVYSMAFDFNALCRIEDETGQDIQSFFTAFEKTVSMRSLRLLVWAGLAKHHSVSLDEAGDIITEAGGVEAVIPAIEKATRAAFPGGAKGKKQTARR